MRRRTLAAPLIAATLAATGTTAVAATPEAPSPDPTAAAGMNPGTPSALPAAFRAARPAPVSRSQRRAPVTPRPKAAPTRVVRPSRPVVGPPAPASPRPTATHSGPSQGEELSVTAYCATGSPNAAGHMPELGEAAGNAWPLGTRLKVEGYGTVVVEDRIGHGSDLDLYMGDTGCEQRADTWGRRELRVTVIGS